MWIIFGWQKIETPLGEVGAVHCFDCQRESQWMVWSEAEWVTFSAIKIFRFVYKHELQCGGCATVLPLRSSEYKQIEHHMREIGTIEGTRLHASLAACIEHQQLAQKTPLQMNFIKESMKAKREYRERMEKQEEML